MKIKEFDLPTLEDVQRRTREEHDGLFGFWAEVTVPYLPRVLGPGALHRESRPEGEEQRE